MAKVTLDVRLTPITAAAFAPFGWLLPPIAAGRLELIEELQNRRPGARARFGLTAVPATALPLVAVEMERHVHSSQAFVPVDGAAYLVLVAPHGPDGLPELARLLAFRVPGDTGINYRADTWHHPLTALDRAGRFAVLTFVDGGAQDEQFVRLAMAVRVYA